MKVASFFRLLSAAVLASGISIAALPAHARQLSFGAGGTGGGWSAWGGGGASMLSGWLAGAQVTAAGILNDICSLGRG